MSKINRKIKNLSWLTEADHSPTEAEMNKFNLILSEIAETVQGENASEMRGLSIAAMLNNYGEIVVACKFEDIFGEICRGRFQLKDCTSEEICHLIKHKVGLIIDGCRAVNIINNMLNQKAMAEGGPMKVQFRWGDTQGDYNCQVVEWDYHKVHIKLNEVALVECINQYKSEGFQKLIESTKIEYNPAKFLRTFNGTALAKQLKILVSDSDMGETLSKKALTTDDVVRIIRNTKYPDGVQYIQSVVIIEELGRFAALIEWNVNYATKKIAARVMDGKILDIEQDEFISDAQIYNRIRKRAVPSDIVLASIFA
jgi:hypothetical protein